jgi:glycine/D-amino acid oxidase-like deaminating enzyme
VAVLEAAEIGFGGSGRNVGLVNAGLWAKPAALRAALGEQLGARLLDAARRGACKLVFDLIEKYRVGLRGGTQRHSALRGRPRGLRGYHRARASQWQALGAPVELLDAETTYRKVGTRRYCGSLLDREPERYSRSLCARPGERGDVARVPRSTRRARSWRPTIWAIAGECARATGSVTAPWVIVATNAYSTEVLAPLRAKLVRLPYFNLATAPLGEASLRAILPERQGLWDTRDGAVVAALSIAPDAWCSAASAPCGARARAMHRSWGRRALLELFPGA